MKPYKFQSQNKGAAIYVESSTTLHNLLFYVRTLWLNNLTVTFLLVRCSCKIQTYCCLCRVKAKNGNKNMTKDFAELHNQIILLTTFYKGLSLSIVETTIRTVIDTPSVCVLKRFALTESR